MRHAGLFIPVAALVVAVACGGGVDPAGSPTPIPKATPELSRSPQVETIAFIRDGDIWLINADGSGERSLGFSNVESFSWVSAEELDAELSDVHLLVDLEGTSQELLFPAGGSWSRDGTQYVVLVDQEVVVYGRDGGEVVRLHVSLPGEEGPKPKPPNCGGTNIFAGEPDRITFGQPVFSSDGERVLVAANCESRRGSGNLYASVASVSLVDGTQRQTDLQANLEDGIGANVAPDGSRVAQAIGFGGSACASEFSLFVADADGANAKELTLPSVAALPEQPGSEEVRGGLIGFDWSPRSDGIVASFDVSVCRHLQEEPFVTVIPVLAGLYILQLDGSPEELLVEGPTSAPAWSPSGRYVAYVAGQKFGEVTGPPGLRVLDLTTGQPVDIGLGLQPAWQPQP
jgi:hypothetical protein